MDKVPKGFAASCRWTRKLASRQQPLSQDERDDVRQRWQPIQERLIREVQATIPENFYRAAFVEDDIARRFLSVASVQAVLLPIMDRNQMTDGTAWKIIRQTLLETVAGVIRFGPGHLALLRSVGLDAPYWTEDHKKMLFFLVLQQLPADDRAIVETVTRICQGEPKTFTEELTADIAKDLADQGISLTTAALRRRYYRAIERMKKYADFTWHMSLRIRESASP